MASARVKVGLGNSTVTFQVLSRTLYRKVMAYSKDTFAFGQGPHPHLAIYRYLGLVLEDAPLL